MPAPWNDERLEAEHLSTTGTMAHALRDALPIVLAYFPIAMTFGVIAANRGIPWMDTVLISAWVYAGAAQFMLVSLFLSGVSPTSLVFTILLVNLRHFLYGTTLGPRLRHWRESQKWIAAFGLTDEVFAVISSRAQSHPPDPAYQCPFAFACYGSWVAGTIAGVAVGSQIPASVSDVLSFALPALFLALLFITVRSGAHVLAAVVGAGGAIIAARLGLGSVGIAIGALTGATAGMLAEHVARRLKPSD